MAPVAPGAQLVQVGLAGAAPGNVVVGGAPLLVAPGAPAPGGGVVNNPVPLPHLNQNALMVMPAAPVAQAAPQPPAAPAPVRVQRPPDLTYDGFMALAGPMQAVYREDLIRWNEQVTRDATDRSLIEAHAGGGTGVVHPSQSSAIYSGTLVTVTGVKASAYSAALQVNTALQTLLALKGNSGILRKYLANGHVVETGRLRNDAARALCSLGSGSGEAADKFSILVALISRGNEVAKTGFDELVKNIFTGADPMNYAAAFNLEQLAFSTTVEGYSAALGRVDLLFEGLLPELKGCLRPLVDIHAACSFHLASEFFRYMVESTIQQVGDLLSQDRRQLDISERLDTIQKVVALFKRVIESAAKGVTYERQVQFFDKGTGIWMSIANSGKGATARRAQQRSDNSGGSNAESAPKKQRTEASRAPPAQTERKKMLCHAWLSHLLDSTHHRGCERPQGTCRFLHAGSIEDKRACVLSMDKVHADVRAGFMAKL